MPSENPVRGVSVTHALVRLWEIANRLPMSGLRDICRAVLENKEFSIAPASGNPKKHHHFRGGLVVHTYEVADYALGLAMGVPCVSTEVLAVSAIVHDFLKTREYGWDDKSNYVIKYPYRRDIRHVAGSYAWWIEAARAHDINQEFTDRVGHCILSHHGRQEWGSPIEPRTFEALILHTADLMSARCDDTGRWIDNENR